MTVEQLIKELEGLPNYPIVVEQYSTLRIDTIETFDDGTCHLKSEENDGFDNQLLVKELKKLDPKLRVIIEQIISYPLSEVTWDSEVREVEAEVVKVIDQKIYLINETEQENQG